MTGIRLSRSTTENTHRFPEWNKYVFYPSGSFVMNKDSDNVVRFYISIEDVPAGKDDPKKNIASTSKHYWSEAFSSNARQLNSNLQTLVDNLTGLFGVLTYTNQIDNIKEGFDDLSALYKALEAKIDFLDSESAAAIKRLHLMIDSEYLARSTFESVITRNVDSDLRTFKDVDSDLKAKILKEITDRTTQVGGLRADYLKLDSELIVKKNYDSDFLAKVRKGDYYISANDYSSIINTTYNTIYQRYDSDFRYTLLNNYKKYNVIDSEYAAKIKAQIITALNAKSLFYQTSASVENFTMFNMVIRVDGANGLQSGTGLLISDFNTVSFSQLNTIIVTFTAVHTPNTGDRRVQTGKYLIQVPQTANTTATATSLYSLSVPSTGTNVLTGITFSTTTNGFQMTANVNYTSTVGTKVTVEAQTY